MDRCDACGAKAHYIAVLAAGPLAFCAHHYRASKAGLEQAHAHVRDLVEEARNDTHASPSQAAG